MKTISFIRFAALAIVLLSFIAPAKADTIPGWYIGAGAVGNFPLDAKATGSGVNDTVQYDTGWGILGDLGYAWSNGIRAEGELSESRANVDKVTGGIGSASGRINNFDVMGNMLYDFQTGTRWTPYIGGGIGFASVDADHIGVLNNGGTLNDSSLEFAYQGIAGVSYEVADNWSVTTDYRYIGTTDPNFKTTAGGSASFENASHNVVIGVRYTMHAPERPAPVLAAAEPMPAPAPPPAPKPMAPAPVPQSYMVFFDFDKYDLTPEAQRILASAAQDFKKGGYVRIVVTGHTDTVGTDSYNQKLSERRADAVKNQLIKLGVNVQEISAIGVGKNGLLVPTADQIREAQNRRAEIVFNKSEQ
jgi:outer membrane protein OmpA-like peptidoglycan-associated protein